MGVSIKAGFSVSKFADFDMDYQYVLITAAYNTVTADSLEGWVVGWWSERQKISCNSTGGW